MSVLVLRHLRLVAICFAVHRRDGGGRGARGPGSDEREGQGARSATPRATARGTRSGRAGGRAGRARRARAGHHPAVPDEQDAVIEFPGQNWDAEGQEIWDDRLRRAGPARARARVSDRRLRLDDVRRRRDDVHRHVRLREREPRRGRDPDRHRQLRGTRTIRPWAADDVPARPRRERLLRRQHPARGRRQLDRPLRRGGADGERTTPSEGCRSRRRPSRSIDVFVACVDQGNATFTARFGYTNPGTVRVSVPAGVNNGFSPGAQDRGQPIVFEPGTDAASVEVSGVANGSTLSWTVRTDGDATRRPPATGSRSLQRRRRSHRPRCPSASSSRASIQARRTYTARFGTNNVNPTAVTIPIGADNRFDPAPQDRGQGTQFAPGNNPNAVTVQGIPNGTDLVWVLNGRTSTASSSFPTRCTEVPPRAPAGSAGAHLRVVRRQRPDDLRGAIRVHNENSTTVSIPVGDDNRFVPTPPVAVRPTLFASGARQPGVRGDGHPERHESRLARLPRRRHEDVHGERQLRDEVQRAGTARAAHPARPAGSTQAARPESRPVRSADRALRRLRAAERQRVRRGLRVPERQPGRGAHPGRRAERLLARARQRGPGERVPTRSRRGCLPSSSASPRAPRSPGASRSRERPSPQRRTWRSTSAVASRRRSSSRSASSPASRHAARRSTSRSATSTRIPSRSILPIGEENRFLPGRFDRGQPSVFLPGRVEDAFTVRGVSDTALLAWYVSLNGRSVVVVGDGYPVRCAGEQRDVPLTLFPLCATRTGPTYSPCSATRT